MSSDLVRRGLAELLGTFAVVLIGAAALVDGDVLATAVGYGLAVAVFATAFGPVSGGHLNPAVTAAHLVTGRIRAGAAAVYWVAQVAGGAVAALFVEWIFPSALNQLYAGAPLLNPNVDVGQGVAIEAVLTALLVVVVLATRFDQAGGLDRLAGLAAGLAVAADVTMGGRFTGAAVNPARALGPEIASGHWTHWWVWTLGPLAGAVLAGLAVEHLFLRTPVAAPVAARSQAPAGRRN